MKAAAAQSKPPQCTNELVSVGVPPIVSAQRQSALRRKHLTKALSHSCNAPMRVMPESVFHQVFSCFQG